LGLTGHLGRDQLANTFSGKCFTENNYKQIQLEKHLSKNNVNTKLGSCSNNSRHQ